GIAALAASVLLAAVGGIAAVIAVQTNANRVLRGKNAELVRSQEAVQARYDLAVAAIKTFHTGVSEDFLLKEEKFKGLRDRLLTSAADFYGRLSALLGRDPDVASRRGAGHAGLEPGGVVRGVGRDEGGRAGGRDAGRRR